MTDTNLQSKLNFNEMLALKTNITHISKAVSYRIRPVASDEQFKNVVSQLIRKDKTYNDGTYFGNIAAVTVEDHCNERWNERVGPQTDLFMIQNLFEYVLAYEPKRITIVSYNFAYLDENICFNYVLKNNHLYIRTFYGRSNLRPGITNIVQTLQYNASNEDKVYLSLTKDELAAQEFPMMPHITLNYQIEDTEYQLLYFHNVDPTKKGALIISEKIAVLSTKYITSFSLSTAKQKVYSYNVLFLLVELGFVKTAVHNLNFKHDVIEELQEHYKKSAIRTFKNWLSKGRVRDLNL
ncbi:MAG: hypothetical protein KBT36_09580 [Kurthia sp.]|nr:hypothetical protein [Candidatus Kurthia equi]